MESFFATNITALNYIDRRNSRQSAVSPSYSDANQLWLPAASELNITELALDCHLYFSLAVVCFLKYTDILE